MSSITLSIEQGNYCIDEDLSDTGTKTELDIALERLAKCQEEITELNEFMDQRIDAHNGAQSIQNNMKVDRFISTEALPWAVHCLEMYADKLNLAPVRTNDISIEAQTIVNAAAAGIHNAFTGMLTKMSNYLDAYKHARQKADELLLAIKTKVNEINPTGEPVLGVVKPEAWCEYLMHLDTGFITGLNGIEKEVTAALVEHSQKVSAGTQKLSAWIKSNAKKMIDGDSKAIESLSFDKNNWIICSGQKWNQSIGAMVPEHGNMFFRGKELPGGRSIFTEALLENAKSTEAIIGYRNLRYIYGYYEPKLYHRNKISITDQTLASYADFAISVGATGIIAGLIQGNTNILKLPFVLTGGYYLIKGMGYHWAKVKDSGKRIKVDSKMRFVCLTPEEIKRTLSDVERGLKAIDTWRGQVFGGTWKDKTTFDSVMGVYELNRASVYEGKSTTHLRNLGAALLHLNTLGQFGIDTYALEVYTAMLKYADMSLRQYNQISK